MDGEDWYYSDDADRTVGPISLERLAQLIREGELPYDVLVSTTRLEWANADRLERVLDALPLDQERLMREYIGYGEAPGGEENWDWASDRMYSILTGVPELGWKLIIEMIERAPSEASLGFLAASPLEDLLSEHGSDFIVRVEQRALKNEKFRRALGMLRRLGMTDEVWNRVRVAGR